MRRCTGEARNCFLAAPFPVKRFAKRCGRNTRENASCSPETNGALLTDLLGEMYRPLPSELSAGNPAAIALLAREKYAAAEAAGVIGEYTAERLKVEYYKNYTDSI